MSVLNGSDILLYDADTDFPLMCQRSVTVTNGMMLIYATCKQSKWLFSIFAWVTELLLRLML